MRRHSLVSRVSFQDRAGKVKIIAAAEVAYSLVTGHTFTSRIAMICK